MRFNRSNADISTEAATGTSDGPVRVKPRLFSNSWATVPLRIFLAAIFLFGGYAKLTYPGFFDPKSSLGFKSAVDSAKANSPISGLLGPLSDHASLFGHITAFAEIAIGLGLLVGLLTRLAALGGMALTTLIVLSVNWSSVREYTGNGGWFTSVDFAVAAALSVFVIGGAGPLSLDRAIAAMRNNRRNRDDAEERAASAQARSAESDADLEESRQRLRGGQQDHTGQPEYPTQQLPGAGPMSGPATGSGPGYPGASSPAAPMATPEPAGSPTPPSDPNSLWNQPRREPEGR
jgi:thiosulfate dehydrogenase [quinone] large subunit